MHLEEYHPGLSVVEGCRQLVPIMRAGDNDEFARTSVNTLPSTPTTTSSSQFCWDNNGSLSPLLLSPCRREDNNEWESLTANTVFQYPGVTCPTTLTNGERSPGSTGSEAVTPNSWGGVFAGSEYGEYSNDEMSDGNSRQRLPSVNSAFSFSRSFSNITAGGCGDYVDYTSYRDYGGEFQDYRECGGYGEDLQLSLPVGETPMSVVEPQAVDSSLQFVDEFDLSLIRGDPTMLLANVGSTSSLSSAYLEELQEPFVGFEGPCYAVGHLVSGQNTGVNIGGYRNNGLSEADGNTGNQIVLPRNEGLMLTDKRRKNCTAAVGTDKNGHDDSFGEDQ